MADVRLTAVNPENSEVYPVACNDKGELILNGASRLEVADFLDVASTTYADNTGLYLGQTPGNVNFREIRLNKDGSAQFSKVVQVGGFVSYVRTDATDQNLASFNSNVGGLNTPQIRFTAGGGATFAGNVLFGAYNASATDTSGARITSSGQLNLQRQTGASTDNRFQVLDGQTVKAAIQNDGSATFAGGAVEIRSDGQLKTQNGFLAYGSSLNSTPFRISTSSSGTSSGNVAVIYNDGSALFAGNVTAPNITFKLAPATVAAMPAPLIDEGFAVNEELDLLSELIKMKLQIRDLNAFMQRTLQDGTETTQ